jgi:cytochrome P450
MTNEDQPTVLQLPGTAEEPALLVRHARSPGPSVIYVHGATFPSGLSVAYRLDGRSWMDDLQARGFDVWAFDFAGYGGSERPRGFEADAGGRAPIGRVDDAVAQLARVVALVRSRTQRERVSLLAHSWGTLVAGRYAGLHPQHIERLVLFGPPAQRSGPAAQEVGGWRLVSIEQQLARFVEDVPAGEAPLLIEPTLAQWGPAYLASDLEAASRHPVPAVKIPAGPQADIAAAWSGALAYEPARISAPTLIVRGEWDGVCDDRDAAWLLEHLGSRDKRDMKLPRGTHLMHVEHGRERLFEATAQWLLPVALADAPAARDPYPLYAALREQGGFAFHEGLSLWVASSAQAVEAALAHPALRVRPPAEPVPAALQGTPAGQVFGGLMRMNDGPLHADAKPRAVSALSLLSTARVRDAAQRVAQRLDSADALNEALFDAPLALLSELFGLADGDRDALVRDLRALVAGWSPRATPAQRNAAQAPAERLLQRFDGDANRIGLFTQTCEATAALIGQTLVALQREPDLWDTLLHGDEAARDALLAEVARHDAPIQNTRRFAAETLTLCGHTLQPGDGVLVLLASANRDAARHAEPDRFDVRRYLLPDTPPPLTWGAATHACPGQRLSRSIAAELLRGWQAAECDLRALLANWTYQPSPNARLPRFV